MWNTDVETRRHGDTETGRAATTRRVSASLRLRVVLVCLLSLFAVLMSACRQDMQDQPRYEVYEPNTFYADGQASRPLVEGTVPRGRQFREADAYELTGKLEGAQAGGAGAASGISSDSGARSGAAQGGGIGTASANVGSGSGGGQPTGDPNVRGNVSGGIPSGNRIPAGAPGGNAASATSGPDRFPFAITEEVLSRGRERFDIYCSMCHGMTGEGDGMIVRRGFRKPPSFHSEQLQPGTADAAHFFDVITNGWGAMPDYSAQIPAEDRWKIIAYVRALQLSRKARLEDVPADKRNRLKSGGGQQQTEGHESSGQGGTHR